MRRFELLHKPINNALVPVVSTKLGVSVSALNFKHAVTDFEHADVKCSATKVEHQNGFVFGAFFKTVCKSGSGWFVNDAQDFETCNCSGFFGGGALCVVKICRNSDDCLGDSGAQIRLGITLEFHEGTSADFLSGVGLAVNVGRLPVFAHVALNAAKRAIRVGNGLTLGNLADEDFTGLRKSHY